MYFAGAKLWDSGPKVFSAGRAERPEILDLGFNVCLEVHGTY